MWRSRHTQRCWRTCRGPRPACTTARSSSRTSSPAACCRLGVQGAWATARARHARCMCLRAQRPAACSRRLTPHEPPCVCRLACACVCACSVDHLLGGGVRETSVTEVAGETCSGKTQVCVCVHASVLERRVHVDRTARSSCSVRGQHLTARVRCLRHPPTLVRRRTPAVPPRDGAVGGAGRARRVLRHHQRLQRSTRAADGQPRQRRGAWCCDEVRVGLHRLPAASALLLVAAAHPTPQPAVWAHRRRSRC
jgi:hypothetical protein